MIVQKTAMRNRGIFAAYQRGESAGDLANRYELFNITVDQIIRCKRHKIAVSGEAFYKERSAHKSSVCSHRSSYCGVQQLVLRRYDLPATGWGRVNVRPPYGGFLTQCGRSGANAC
jgi:hypothetical protein